MNRDIVASKKDFKQTLAGKSIGHIIDGRSENEVRYQGSIDVDEEKKNLLALLSYRSVFSNHSLKTTASGTAIEIRSTSDRDTNIIFVGSPGAFILKSFAEHQGYTKSKIYLGTIDEFISEEKKLGGQADQILDEIFD